MILVSQVILTRIALGPGIGLGLGLGLGSIRALSVVGGVGGDFSQA